MINSGGGGVLLRQGIRCIDPQPKRPQICFSDRVTPQDFGCAGSRRHSGISARWSIDAVEVAQAVGRRSGRRRRAAQGEAESARASAAVRGSSR